MWPIGPPGFSALTAGRQLVQRPLKHHIFGFLVYKGLPATAVACDSLSIARAILGIPCSLMTISKGSRMETDTRHAHQNALASGAIASKTPKTDAPTSGGDPIAGHLPASGPVAAPVAWSATALFSAALAACGGGSESSLPNAAGAQAMQSMPFDNAPVASTLIANAAPSKALLRQAPSAAILQQPTVSADALMDWAQSALPSYFPGAPATNAATTDGVSYVFRMYNLAGGAFNAIAVTGDARVFLLGAVTGGKLTQYGTLPDYVCSVYPNTCPAPGVPLFPANVTESSRFFAQASLGATKDDINALLSTNYNAWIDAQIALLQSPSHYDWLISKGYNDPLYINGENGLTNTIWRKLIGGNDMLRQRVTLALSEICVVSVIGIPIQWRQFAAANYLDILENNAFGNYRTLLDQITLSTAMGTYLTYRGNAKASTGGSQPDENYARELMQLFTIGLVNLNQDGTPKLTNGAVTESYTQADVSGLARVFTGWDFNLSGLTSPYPPDQHKRPMIQINSRYETGSKTFLGTTIPAGTSAIEGLRMALDTLFNHPNLPPFLSKQLIQRLVTSNPSSAYVRRVADTFTNNGSGVRGDLRATLKAVLLDSEARDMAKVSDVTFGKIREPMVRFLNWARATSATSPSDVWALGELSDPASKLAQSPLRSPSVFNFFRPGYIQAGSDLAARGLASPELQIIDETSVSGYVNFMQKTIQSGIADLKGNYAAWMAMATNSAALLNDVHLVLAANQIPITTINMLKTALDTIAVTNDAGKLNRVYAAVTLVMASPAYIAQK